METDQKQRNTYEQHWKTYEQQRKTMGKHGKHMEKQRKTMGTTKLLGKALKNMGNQMKNKGKPNGKQREKRSSIFVGSSLY